LAGSNDVVPRARGFADSLWLRVLSGAVFIPVFAFLTWRGGVAFLCFVLLFVGLGLDEFYKLLATKGERPYRRLGIATGLVLVISSYVQLGIHDRAFLSFVLLLTMAIELLRHDNRGAVHAIGDTLFGIFYVAWLGSHLVFLRELPRLAGQDYSAGARWIFLVFLCTWGNDAGAYLAGRRYGRHPLLPRVSPRKSVEGAIGGLLAGTLLGTLAGPVLVAPMPAWAGPFLGLLAAASGQIGDLVESLLKRDVERKDSAAIMVIPGHGGVLDRFDSILFAAPAVYYVVRGLVM
jgi:phosphatidate cytidylyltransferase